MAKKIWIGIVLALVILTSSIYMLMPDKVRIDFEKTRTVFKVYEDGKFVISAIEYTRIFDGTTLMRANDRSINYSIEESTTEWHRISNFKDEIVVEDFYTFDNQATDVEDVPINHKICFTNAKDKIFEYLVSDITYNGISKKIESPFSFEKNMKVTFQDGYYSAKVVQNKVAADKIIVRYRINSDYECFDVRLFDPPKFNPLNPSFETGSLDNWTYTGGVAQLNDTAHTGVNSAKIIQTGGVNTLLYQNLTSLNLTNATNYIASGWIYIHSGQVGENMHGLLQMGSGIGSTAARQVYGNTSSSNTTDTWMQVNLTFTYNNATDLYFNIFANGSVSGGGYVLWDDVYIFDYSAPSPSNQSEGTIWMTPKSNYNDSLWMIDFNLDGENGTAYDVSCGALPTANSLNVTAHKTGTYALTYNSERTSLGRSEQSRFSLYKFPRRFYENTYRAFFQFNTTLTTDTTLQINVNMSDILNNTGISGDINSSTLRLYRISRQGGIYNDTSLCYEQPITVG